MNELIQIEPRDMAGIVEQTCNARDLHVFLEVATSFKDWIVRRIADYGFEEGRDFCSFLSESSGGRPSKDYVVTLAMAKELAMVERNEKGKQARQYFLDCERRAKSLAAGGIPPSTLSALKLVPMVARAARALGLDKNAAALSANQAVAKLTGANVLQLLGRSHLEAENQEALFLTPTELGERMGISGRKFNMLLAKAGLQAKQSGHWAPMKPADGLFRIFDTSKRQGDGAMVQQLKWAADVLPLVGACQ